MSSASAEYVEQVMWHIGTSSMVLNLLLCTIFAIITILGTKRQHQQRSSKSGHSFSRNSNRSRFSFINKTKQGCISYFFYSFAALCTLQCFLCHYSMLWYHSNGYIFCRWAAPICLVIFFSAKACLYGFFLERAKAAQGLLNIFPQCLFKYLLPIYIFLYWLIWTLCIMIFFEGAPNESVTSCITVTYLDWILIFGGIIDVINTILFLFLFIYPLYKAYMMNKAGFDDNINKKKNFINMMWYNIILSTICTLSSFTFLFIMQFIYGYQRMGEQVDMMINSICVFFMLATNRKYVRFLCYQYCNCCGCYHDDKCQNKQYETVDTRTNTEITEIDVTESQQETIKSEI